MTARPRLTLHQPQLDGLRAVAVFFVLMEHFSIPLPALVRFGPLCVRFFFVLSGYFITLTLWKMRAQVESPGPGGTRRMCNFYLNRLLRVAPPFYLCLAVGALLGITEVREHFFWLATFQTNNYVAWLGYWPESISHFWSLAVQEQFYLLWPCVIFCLPRRWFMPAMAALIVFGFVFRLVCIATSASTLLRWVTLFGCIDSFAVGALVAWLRQEGHLAKLREFSRNVRSALTLTAFACLFLGGALMTLPETNLWLSLTETVGSVFLAWLLAQTILPVNGWCGRVLSLAPLAYIGRISYGIYIYHVFVIVLVSPLLVTAGLYDGYFGTIRLVILTLISVLAAAVSWHFLEKPCSAWKDLLLTSAASEPAPKNSRPGIPVPAMRADRPVIRARPLVLSGS